MKDISALVKSVEDKRKELDLTREDVCSRLGISLSSYKRWIRGESRPTTDNYIKLLEFMENGK